MRVRAQGCVSTTKRYRSALRPPRLTASVSGRLPHGQAFCQHLFHLLVEGFQPQEQVVVTAVEIQQQFELAGRFVHAAGSEAGNNEAGIRGT